MYMYMNIHKCYHKQILKPIAYLGTTNNNMQKAEPPRTIIPGRL